MDNIFIVNGYKICVHFDLHTVRLKANYALRRLMRSPQGISHLTNAILHTYKDLFKSELLISPRSLIAEIKGHIVSYECLLFMRRCVDLRLFKFLSYRVCKIDCGERIQDGNRWVWDILARL